MVKWFLIAVLAALPMMAGSAATADERVTLGWGRIFTNDQIGDGKDRWRTGSYTVSRLRGPSWQGHAAHGFGDILELRGHAGVIAPSNLTSPAANDRRYAGVLSFGLNTHFGWQGAEVNLGAELALTGPRSGIGSFQKWFHNQAGMVPPSSAVLDAQIGNRLHPGLNAEIGRSLALGDAVHLRPFAEARLGVESLVRVGGDITIGRFGQGGLLLRDVTTGQRYRGIEGTRSEGLSLTLGGDLAYCHGRDGSLEGPSHNKVEDEPRAAEPGLPAQLIKPHSGNAGGSVSLSL
jgi:hypothetical protein